MGPVLRGARVITAIIIMGIITFFFLIECEWDPSPLHPHGARAKPPS